MVNLKKASRQGRYRKLLLAPQSLAPLAPDIEAVFDALNHIRQQGILSDAEFVSYGLLTLLACRRQHAFQPDKTRVRKKPNPDNTTNNFQLSDFWQLLCSKNLPISNYKKILDQETSVYHFLNQIRFRGIPDSAQMALLKWLEKQYPLTLVFHIPSATEVFELQKKGGRCISFLKKASALTELHHDRDAMSFIIHDLIHAHEFYANTQRAKQQIGFYHWLDNIKTNPKLVVLLTESDEFLKRWEYVLSDMNSYCGHLLKTLNAAFSIFSEGGDKNSSLWYSVVDASNLEQNEKQLFRRVNSVEWNEADFLQLELVLEKRFELAKSNTHSVENLNDIEHNDSCIGMFSLHLQQ